jgi:hypothetical protein
MPVFPLIHKNDRNWLWRSRCMTLCAESQMAKFLIAMTSSDWSVTRWESFKKLTWRAIDSLVQDCVAVYNCKEYLKRLSGTFEIRCNRRLKIFLFSPHFAKDLVESSEWERLVCGRGNCEGVELARYACHPEGWSGAIAAIMFSQLCGLLTGGWAVCLSRFMMRSKSSLRHVSFATLKCLHNILHERKGRSQISSAIGLLILKTLPGHLKLDRAKIWGVISTYRTCGRK